MSKDELIKILQDKNVITKNKKRKFFWKENFDDECKLYFDKFKLNYRSEEEAWFCLLKNVEPYHCEVCGKLAKFTGTKKTKYPGYNTTCENCSPNCATEKKLKFSETIEKRTDLERYNTFLKRKQTNLERYGDENYTLYGSDKFKQTMKDWYGDEYYHNNEKRKQTCLDKYGVTCNLAIKNRKRKRKRNIKEEKLRSILKYGYDSPNKSPEVIKRQQESLIKYYGSIKEAYKHKAKVCKETKLQRYGDPNYHNKEQASETLRNKSKMFEEKYNCTKFTTLVKQYGQGWFSLNLPVLYNGRFRYISNTYLPIIKDYSETCHNLNSVSKQETELYEFIKTCIGSNYRIYRNHKNIINDDKQKYELDIYIPKLKIAFEFNGIYWHSNLLKNKYYHQTKTKLCYENGIQLIHIYEFDWIKNKDQLKLQIKELLNGNDCTKYGWIPVKEYSNYILTEPQICFEIENKNLVIYNEGKFIKKSF